MRNAYNFFKKTSKGLLVLIDPDKFNPDSILNTDVSDVAAYLVGGSVLKKGVTENVLKALTALSSKPVFIFPGDETQLAKPAYGILLPILISGRNADYLIGKHVLMAPQLDVLKIPVIPMAYILLSGGKRSATERISKTQPLAIAPLMEIQHTVRAAYYLGYRLLYLEAGSGAKNSIPVNVIKYVRRIWPHPLIVGGGIRNKSKIKAAFRAGADWVVIGTALEKNPMFVKKLLPLNI
jgi:phosphoglycerol geranylgeranyltransferase